MSQESDTEDLLSNRMRAGEQACAGEVFTTNRQRLRRMIQLRLDRRLQGRIDASTTCSRRRSSTPRAG